MRPIHLPRFAGRRRATARALWLALPITTAALAVPAVASAAADTTNDAPTVPAHVSAHRVAFGHRVVLTGTLSGPEVGHRLELEFRPTGTPAWRVLGASTVATDGRYRLSAPLRRSGAVRVVDASAPTGTPVAAAGDVTASPAGQRVSVAAELRVNRGSLASFGGGPVQVSGRMLPRLSGRLVRLQTRRGRAWQTVATTATGRGGAFSLRFAPAGSVHGLRVRFAGDAQNAATSAATGDVTAYSASVSSWYNDAGTTGCGFHATYGVANKSLACGTKVTIAYGGRSIVATVDDRGPYVGGRTWDLNQNTAAALGFAGVGTIWTSY